MRIENTHVAAAIKTLGAMPGAKEVEGAQAAAWLAALSDPLREGESPGTPQELMAACKDVLREERFWPGLGGLIKAMRRVRAAARASLPPVLGEAEIAAREECQRLFRAHRDEIARDVQGLVGDFPHQEAEEHRRQWATWAWGVLDGASQGLSLKYGINLKFPNNWAGGAMWCNGVRVEVFGLVRTESTNDTIKTILDF